MSRKREERECSWESMGVLLGTGKEQEGVLGTGKDEGLGILHIRLCSSVVELQGDWYVTSKKGYGEAASTGYVWAPRGGRPQRAGQDLRPYHMAQQSHSWAYIPKETVIQKCTCTPMFTETLFTIARTWKQPKCPSTDGWIKKMWYW